MESFEREYDVLDGEKEMDLQQKIGVFDIQLIAQNKEVFAK